MKIHFYDDDKRASEPDYNKRMGSFGTVAYNINKTLKKLGHYAELQDAEWVGKCGSLDPQFKIAGKKSFYINVWETNNTLPNYLLYYAQGQNMFGLCDKTTNLWRKYGFKAETIYGGCDTDFWYPTKEKNANIFTFGHVNHATVRSGLEVSLKAFALAFRNNPDVQFIVKDTSEFNDKLFAFIQSLQTNNIKYINEFWTTDQIRDFYSENHTTVNLLRSTSFGMPLLECSACDSLCITGDVTPTNELVSKDFAKMIPSNGEINVYPFVEDVADKYGLKNYYGQFQYPEMPVFWNFDVSEVAQEFLEVYKNWDTYKKIDKRQPIIDKWKWEYTVENLIKQLQKLDENSIY